MLVMILRLTTTSVEVSADMLVTKCQETHWLLETPLKIRYFLIIRLVTIWYWALLARNLNHSPPSYSAYSVFASC